MNAAYILYVEDNENDVLLLRHTLKTSALPAEIVHVSTSQEFSAAIEHLKPDLILADSNVPGFDTTAALALARQCCPTTPFFYLTSFTTEQRTAALRAAGARGCLLKNDRRAVSAAISEALGQRTNPEPRRDDAMETRPHE